MAEIGVRELKARASEVLREVRDRRARYTVTYRGKPVGMLIPFPEAPQAEALSDQEAWDELTRLGEEISKHWQSPLTSTEILAQMRR